MWISTSRGRHNSTISQYIVVDVGSIFLSVDIFGRAGLLAPQLIYVVFCLTEKGKNHSLFKQAETIYCISFSSFLREFWEFPF
jgi:hypothetical protein